MTERKWTPGPWVVVDASDFELDKSRFKNGAFQVMSNDCDNHAVADCSCNHTCRMDWECKANAHLIAAAPELYEALEACKPFADGYGFINGVNIIAALAKARGEA